MSEFDKEQVYDEQISPLMQQIIEICREHDIPHIVTFFIGGEEGDMMCTTSNTTHEHTPESYKEAIRAIYQPRTFTMAMTITRGDD